MVIAACVQDAACEVYRDDPVVVARQLFHLFEFVYSVDSNSSIITAAV